MIMAAGENQVSLSRLASPGTEAESSGSRERAGGNKGLKQLLPQPGVPTYMKQVEHVAHRSASAAWPSSRCCSARATTASM